MSKGKLILLVFSLFGPQQSIAQGLKLLYRDSIPWTVALNQKNLKETLVFIDLSKESRSAIYRKVFAIVQYRSSNGAIVKTDTLAVTDKKLLVLQGGNKYLRRYNNGFSESVTVIGIHLQDDHWVLGGTEQIMSDPGKSSKE